MNEPIQNIDAFLGLRNREQPRRMKLGSLTVAENIDIDDMGGIAWRQGNALSFLLTDMTASFSTQDERRMFVVDNGDLKLVNPDFTLTTLKPGVSTDYIYWLEIADYIVMSSGEIIDKDNNVSTWQIPTPVLPKIVKVTGDLPQGQYQVVYTYVDVLRREGSASDVSIINVDGGLSITPKYISGYTIRLYFSDVNGKELYFQGEYLSGSILIENNDNLVYPIDEIQLKAHDVPENISCIAFYEASLWVCGYHNGITTIFQSEPFWWNLFDLQHEHLKVPGKVNMIVGIKEGLAIGTDDEIYIYTIEDQLVKLAEYGTPTGKPYAMDDNGHLFIHSNQGLCIAAPFKNLTEDKVSLPSGGSNHVSFIEKDGFKKIVVLTDGVGTEDNKL